MVIASEGVATTSPCSSEANHRSGEYTATQCLTDCLCYSIHEFVTQLNRLRLDSHLDHAENVAVLKVENKIQLSTNFFNKFSQIWESLSITDR